MCLQEPLSETGEIGISHSAYEMRKSQGVWTAIQKGSGLVFDERMDLSRRANDNVIATDIRRRGKKRTSIVNIYN